MFQEADGILARFVLPPAKRLLIKTDYYAAPDCNALCSSGSGTPKADGTQSCECNQINKATLTSVTWTETSSSNNRTYSYSGYTSNHGSIDNENFYGANIEKIYSRRCSKNCGLTKFTRSYVVFSNPPSISGALKILIDGTEYILSQQDSTTWHFSGSLRLSAGQHIIEFLN